MKQCQVKTDNGTVLNAVYVVKSVEKIVTSHYVSGSSICINAEYPADLQPRNREGIVMVSQVSKMSRDLRPDELSASIFLNQGAPVVRPDGIVLNGNGRSIAVSYAYRAGLPSADKYKRYLVDHAGDFGFTANQITAISQPILVREIVDDLDDGLIDEIIHSTVGGSVMSTFEQAKIDAAKLSVADFAHYDDESNGDLTAYKNDAFVGAVLWRIAKDTERALYWNANGKLTRAAIERVRNAIFALAYQDDGLIDKMTLSNDDGARNISNALIIAAPKFAKLRLQCREGIYRSYDMAPILSRAIARFNYVRSTNEFKSVKQFLETTPLFDPEPVEVANIMRFFDANKRSQKIIVMFLQNIIGVIKSQGNPNQESLAGFEHESLSIEDVVSTAIFKTNEFKAGGCDILSTIVISDDIVESDKTNAIDNAQNVDIDNADKSAEAVDSVKSIIINQLSTDKPVDTDEISALTSVDALLNQVHSIVTEIENVVCEIGLNNILADFNAAFTTTVYPPRAQRRSPDQQIKPLRGMVGRRRKIDKVKMVLSDAQTLIEQINTIATEYHIDVPDKPSVEYPPRAERTRKGKSEQPFFNRLKGFVGRKRESKLRVDDTRVVGDNTVAIVNDGVIKVKVKPNGYGGRDYYAYDYSVGSAIKIPALTLKGYADRGCNIVFYTD